MRHAYLLVIVVLLTLAWLGRYEMQLASSAIVILDRWTGAVQICTAHECNPAPN